MCNGCRGIIRLYKWKDKASTKDFTFIYTGLGSAFLGDAVLYLKDSPCQNLILFGACGLTAQTKELKIGSIVSPGECYAWESFSDNLFKESHNLKLSYPDKDLLNKLTVPHSWGIKRVRGATLGSVNLELENLNVLKEKGIEAVDMECSAFFNAAQFIKRKAVSMLYATDIIDEKSVYAPFSPDERRLVHAARKKTADILKHFCKELTGPATP